jgi:hypothetical protein
MIFCRLFEFLLIGLSVTSVELDYAQLSENHTLTNAGSIYSLIGTIVYVFFENTIIRQYVNCYYPPLILQFRLYTATIIRSSIILCSKVNNLLYNC